MLTTRHISRQTCWSLVECDISFSDLFSLYCTFPVAELEKVFGGKERRTTIQKLKNSNT